MHALPPLSRDIIRNRRDLSCLRFRRVESEKKPRKGNAKKEISRTSPSHWGPMMCSGSSLRDGMM